MPVSQVKSLLLIASHISGYPIPSEAPPPVYLATPQEIAHEACADDPLSQLSCSIIGFYEYPIPGQTERIVIDNNADVAGHSANSIAVHELTHWLQYRNWKNPDDHSCPREFLREYQAYLAGFTYEVQYEHQAPPEGFDTPQVSCPWPKS